MDNVVVTPRVAACLGGDDVDILLDRHFKFDYGIIPMEQQMANDLAMFRRMGMARSMYELQDGRLVVVKTVYNQEFTTVGLEDEI